MHQNNSNYWANIDKNLAGFFIPLFTEALHANWLMFCLSTYFLINSLAWASYNLLGRTREKPSFNLSRKCILAKSLNLITLFCMKIEYHNIYTHFIFSTYERQVLIPGNNRIRIVIRHGGWGIWTIQKHNQETLQKNKVIR